MPDALEPIDLAEFRAGAEGRQYRDFVQHHLNAQTARDRNLGFVGTVQMLPAQLQPLMEGFIDRWNVRMYDHDFWRQDCAQVLDAILDDARNMAQSVGYGPDDEDLFNIFQLVSMSFAYNADLEPKFRAYAGVKRKRTSWVWITLVALGAIVLVNVTDNPVLLVAGWLVVAVLVWPRIFGRR
jgi:hypothetical protein